MGAASGDFSIPSHPYPSHILSILKYDAHSPGVAQGVWELLPSLSHSPGGVSAPTGT